MEYYSAIKKNEIMSFAAMWMNLDTVTMSEVKERQIIIWYHLYVESKKKKRKNGTNEPIYKTEIVTDVENKLMATKGKGAKG